MIYLSKKSFINNIRHINTMRKIRKEIDNIWFIRNGNNDMAIKEAAVFSKLIREIFNEQ